MHFTFYRTSSLPKDVAQMFNLLAPKIDFYKASAVLLRRFPANLASQPGFIARPLQVRQVLQEIKQNSFEKVPILRAAGE